VRRLLSSALAIAVLTLASGCVVASPDADTYEDAAASSVGSVASEVATVQLLLNLLDRHRITDAAVVTQLRYSEKNLASAAQGLTGLNAPPEEDPVSSKAGDLFDQAEALVESARTAVHREDTAHYASIASSLKALGKKLTKLEGKVS
jgi:hypothetical protein